MFNWLGDVRPRGQVETGLYLACFLLCGLYIEKQKVTNVTTGWGVFQVDINDWNQFAGPLINKPATVAALPTCSSSLDGARMYVTDQNTAVAYRGAVTGGGTTHQPVICNGATPAWIQD